MLTAGSPAGMYLHHEGTGLPTPLAAALFTAGWTLMILAMMLPSSIPLVVVFAQKYVKSTGIGTLTALMLPYSLTFLCLWTVYLLVYWQLGLPLFKDVPYTYVPQ